jgi:hypothetical protein
MILNGLSRLSSFSGGGGGAGGKGKGKAQYRLGTFILVIMIFTADEKDYLTGHGYWLQ